MVMPPASPFILSSDDGGSPARPAATKKALKKNPAKPAPAAPPSDDDSDGDVNWSAEDGLDGDVAKQIQAMLEMARQRGQQADDAVERKAEKAKGEVYTKLLADLTEAAEALFFRGGGGADGNGGGSDGGPQAHGRSNRGW